MEVRPEAASRVADAADDGSGSDHVPALDLDARQMAVPALEPVAMVDVDLQAAACVRCAGEHDLPAACRADAIAGLAVDVDPLVDAVLGLVSPNLWVIGPISGQRHAVVAAVGRGVGFGVGRLAGAGRDCTVNVTDRAALSVAPSAERAPRSTDSVTRER